jgi:hypothetical protein
VKLVGHILKLQVQRSSLKVPNVEGSAHWRRFDTGPLLDVHALMLTPTGVFGLLQDASDPIIDVHNIQHPASRNSNGVNGVSIGFTSHYAAMRDYFGEHLRDGDAGENILVAADVIISEPMLSAGVTIETQDGAVQLERLMVAEPCVEFTRYALQRAPSDPGGEQVTAGLQFLREGTRGFYATYAGSGAVVRPGDALFLRD